MNRDTVALEILKSVILVRLKEQMHWDMVKEAYTLADAFLGEMGKNKEKRLMQVQAMYEKNVRLYREMVGNFYPGLLYRDMMNQRDEYISLGGKEGDLTPVRPPNEKGYVQ